MYAFHSKIHIFGIIKDYLRILTYIFKYSISSRTQQGLIYMNRGKWIQIE